MAVPRPVSMIRVAVYTGTYQDSRSLWVRKERQSVSSRIDTSTLAGPHLSNNHSYGYQRGNRFQCLHH
jgi:hypothetical protein